VAFHVITSRSKARDYQPFGETCCLHLQSSQKLMQWVPPLVNIYRPTLCYNSLDYSLNTILILLNFIHAYFVTNYYEVCIFEIKYHETTISFVTVAGIGDFSTNSINLYRKLWNVCSIWGRGWFSQRSRSKNRVNLQL